jgi:hypothetical protein
MRKGPGEVQSRGTFLKKTLPQCGAEGGLISGITHWRALPNIKNWGF